MAKKPIRNLVIFSDTHCGCKLAICRPERQRLDGTWFYSPSEFQERLYELWREFWDEWVPEVTKGEPYDVIHNGDVIDGVHHNSTTQISHNITDQKRIAVALLKPEIDRCKGMGGTYYHIRGTEAHVGQAAQYEEELAKELGAKPNDVGQYARYDIWKRVGGKDGPLVHALHHIGTTASAAHESSAVNAELVAAYVEAGRWDREPPTYTVRSHRHRFIAVNQEGAKGYTASIVTPAWQGKTGFVWKVAGGRQTEPQVGGICIRRGDEEHYYRSKVWSFDRSAEE